MFFDTLKLKNYLGLTFLSAISFFLIKWHPQSFYSFVLVGCLCLILAKILSFKYADVILLYFFYVFMALLVFHLLNYIIPQYKGFNGELGIGEDDLYFFDQVAGFNPIYDHESRPGAYTYIHNFSKFLKVYAWFIPYRLHLVDLLIFNILPLVLIPPFLVKFASKMFKSEKYLNHLFIFSAICPFMMMNGVIILRDAWMALFFIFLVWGFIERRIILSIAFTILIGFFRQHSMLLAVLLATIILIAYLCDTNHVLKRKISAISSNRKLMIIIPFIIIIVSGIVLSTLFFRSEFVSSFLTDVVVLKNRTSVYYKIFSSPWYIRLSVGFIFFWGAPFVSLKNLYVLDKFVLRGVFEQFFGLLFFFYIPIYFQSFVSLFKRNSLWLYRGIHFAYLLGILVLSQMSLQVRHKIMLMPLFYLILYIGLINSNDSGKKWGIALSIILLVITIYANALFFMNGLKP